MGSGASKKKGANGEIPVHKVNVGAAQASDEAPQDDATPERPKASPSVRRPRPAGPRKEEADDSEVTGSPPVPHQQAKAASRPPLPKAPPAQKNSAVLEEEDEDIEEAEQEALKASAATKLASRDAQDVPVNAEVVSTAEESVPAKPKASEQVSREASRQVVDVDAFFAACRGGDVGVVQAFLSQRARTAKGLADCEEALFDAYGDSVLHHAVSGGHVQVAQLLLELGRVQVDIPNARNETALQLACRKADMALVDLLLKAEADPDRRDANGLTPFLSGVFMGGNVQILDRLAQAGANVSIQDYRGVSALHFAALRGDMFLQRWLLDHKADVDLQTEHNTTSLMLAAKRGHVESVALLLENQANTNLTDEAGCTALMQALCMGNAEVASMILERGASVDVVDCAGRSALFHAVLGGKVEGLIKVIESKGRVNILDEEGRSPLYQACLMGADLMVKQLLDVEADPNLAGRSSVVRPPAPADEEEEAEAREAGAARACLEEARTCLQVCATLGHNNLLAVMLDHGADIDAAPGALGWTSLHLCAAVGNHEGIALLLSRGANIFLEDAEGNLAENLASRAGQEAVLEKLREAAAKQESEEASGKKSPARRNQFRGTLPPIHAGAVTEAPPAEETAPLETYKAEWTQRNPNGSLLDAVCGPMVHDALMSEQWRDRYEALVYLTSHFSEVAGAPADVTVAICELVTTAAKDKVAKVFLASLTLLEELLCDARADVLGTEEFTALITGAQSERDATPMNATTSGRQSLLDALLNQVDAGGSSSASSSSSPQQAAVDALCSCILHGRVHLDAVAFPLMCRISERLQAEVAGKSKDRKETAILQKGLPANFKIVNRLLLAFGLQQTGLFRRALVLPLLLRGVASEHSKVRGSAGDALVQLLALGGGIEERVWALLPAKGRKAVTRLISSKEGVSMMAVVPCEEDILAKAVIVGEDSRASAFVAVSELTPQVWASFQGAEAGADNGASRTTTNAKQAIAAVAAMSAPQQAAAVPDDAAAEALQNAFASKNWKERAESINALGNALATAGEGVRLIEADGASENPVSNDSGPIGGGGPLLSQYVLKGHRLSTLQASIGMLLSDSVTAVFVAASELLRLTSTHVPLYIAPIFLEPLLPALVARLLDTAHKVRAKALETTLEVAALHSCALSEMIAQCVASGSAWSSAPPGTSGGGSAPSDRSAPGRDCERSTGPRLQLLSQIVQQAYQQGAANTWTSETWTSLADYALKAAEHRSGDVRKEAAALLNSMRDIGGLAGLTADDAITKLQALADKRAGKRPGTTSTRQNTGRVSTSTTRLGTSSRLGTASRLGTSSRLGTGGHSTLGASLVSLQLGSTGRLSTGRLTTGSLRSKTSYGRPGTGAVRRREEDEESDNSVHSNPDKPVVPTIEEAEGGEGAADGGTADDEGGGIAFYDVQTACPGADEVPEFAEGEAALAEALPLAEPLDEVALDFVAPLIALFGDGWTRCFYSRMWQCRVAALVHLSASMSRRIDDLAACEASPVALGELLDGSMRAVHEGLGDQNVQVYAQACRAVNAVVPVFCGLVDGRLLVAHLAPLLRQLCARMGDAKEAVRLHTVQALFRLLHPPIGDIVSPVAIATLILRHLVVQRDDSPSGSPPLPPKAGKGAVTGWLCRIGALRDLVKEYPKTICSQPGATHPGEWLRLKDGIAHSDPTVRYESARLFALICKTHVRSLPDEDAQTEGREAWVAALPKDLPSKCLAQVRKLLKLPEKPKESLEATATLSPTRAKAALAGPWEVPSELVAWAGCEPEVLAVLSMPAQGDEKEVLTALRALGKAVCQPEESLKRGGSHAEAFAGVCKAIQQALSSAVGTDRQVFMTAVDLCQTVVAKIAPQLSGLDVNMGLAKTFPTLVERTSTTADVKMGVASDKLVQQLAKHPKVGCEAVTKMIISAVSRIEKPSRPLVLLRTLLGDFGLRLCAQRDIISLLLGTLGMQLEYLSKVDGTAVGSEKEREQLRVQIVDILGTCNQFSPDTMRQCLAEVDAANRKVLQVALQEAPDPRLVALGASAAYQEQIEVTAVAGSAIRAASRGRGQSPKLGERRPSIDFNSGKSPSRPPIPIPVARVPSGQDTSSASPIMREGSPGRRHKRNRDRESRESATSLPLSEVSTGASTACPSQSPGTPTASPRQQRSGASAAPVPLAPPRPGRQRSGETGFEPGMTRSDSGSRWCNDGSRAKPPAPMELSTAMTNGRGARNLGQAEWSFAEAEDKSRAGTSDGRLMKSKEAKNGDSLSALMDVLSQIDRPGRKTR